MGDLTALSVVTGAPDIGSPSLADDLRAVEIATDASGTGATKHEWAAWGDTSITLAPVSRKGLTGSLYFRVTDPDGSASAWYGPVTVDTALTAVGVTTASPDTGSPAIGQTHGLTADDTVTAAPALGTPTLADDARKVEIASDGTGTGATTHPYTSWSDTSITLDTVDRQGLAAASFYFRVTDPDGTASDWYGPVTIDTALAAAGITAGAPDIGAPTLAELVDSLSADDITAGAPVLGTPTLDESADFTDVFSLSYTLTPTWTESYQYALDAADLTTGAVAVEAATLGQVHALSADGLASGAPALGTSTLGQIHALTAQDLETDSPDTGSPVLGFEGEDDLQAASIVTGAPVLDAPDIGIVYALTADSITTAAPDLGSPDIGAVNALQAEDIETAAPDVESPGIGQAHVLEALGITTGNPIVGSPSFRKFVNRRSRTATPVRGKTTYTVPDGYIGS